MALKSLASAFRLIPYRLLKRLVNIHVRVQLAGRCLVIPLDGGIGLEHVYWRRSWETECIERLVNIRNGAFVDVGANVGQTLLNLLITHPETTYIGFEPNPFCVNYLIKLIRANELRHHLVIPIGLADENKIFTLYAHKGKPTDSCATIISDLRPGRAYDLFLVPCFRFDDIRETLGLSDIGFVKIDVEGAELETLTGMQSTIKMFRPLILCEVLFTDSKANDWPKQLRNSQLMQLLAGLNYEVLQLVKSSDGTRVVQAQKIYEFPSGYWSPQNSTFCDYLFIPAGEEARILSVLLC